MTYDKDMTAAAPTVTAAPTVSTSTSTVTVTAAACRPLALAADLRVAVTHAVRRIRQERSSEQITDGQYAVLATLRDITTIGIAVHAHTAAFHGAQPTTGPEPTLNAHGAEALVLRGRAWQWLHRELSHFVTLAPPSATVRDDLVALSRLLPALAPLEARASS